MEGKIEIYGRRRDGSDVAEACLTLADIPYAFISLEYDKPGADRDRLLRLNPLAQVPTLKLPNGKILTETLAVAIYAQDTNPSVNLIPKDENLRSDFWRFATMIVAAVYPTFTYGDDPSRWVNDKAAPELRTSTDERRKKIWHYFEEHAREPYFLGSEFSLIDIYLKVMTTWRPGPEWFAKETPKLFAIAERVQKDPRLAKRD